MLFTDPVFLLLLLPLACVLFYSVTPRFGASAGFGLLLVVSLLFYWAWGTFYLILLVLSFTANFISACALLRIADERRNARRAALTLGLLYNFGTLIWFKYRFFFISLGGGASYSLVDVAIPIGISFYTFQQAIFLVDAYHRDEAVVAYLGDMGTVWGKLRGYVHHAFFVAFFPHLVIGPIVYLREFQPQIETANFGRVKRANLEVGIALIILGMFKKVVLADNLGPVADKLFAAIDVNLHVPMAVAWVGTLAYYTQLYFDFSGYADMALGCARVLGIRFPMNFYSPLQAVGIVDFYRRWHITLTRVIARFMYTPLSVTGTRFAMAHRWPKWPSRAISLWLPLLLNFEVIALWHGARYTFVLFGLIHGIWYVVETEIRAGKTFKAWRKKTSDRLRGFLGRAIFFVLMSICFGLFRSTSLGGFRRLLGDMFTPSLSLPHALAGDGGKVALGLAIVWLLPNSMAFLERFRPGIATYDNKDYTPSGLRLRWRPDWLWSVVLVAMLLGALYSIARQPPFLYMGF